MNAYIRCDKSGTPIGHIVTEAPLAGYATRQTAAGKKPYLVPAVLIDANPGPLQVKTGPVYDTEAETITYGVAARPEGEIEAMFSTAIQARLDAFARTRLYDNILSACSYHGSADPAFAAEGARCIELRDATWRAAWTIMADVQAGTRPVPTVDEIFAELPALTWE